MKEKKGVRERRISFHDLWDEIFWCSYFGVSSSELRRAIKHAGTDADAVFLYLEKYASQRAYPE